MLERATRKAARDTKAAGRPSEAHGLTSATMAVAATATPTPTPISSPTPPPDYAAIAADANANAVRENLKAAGHFEHALQLMAEADGGAGAGGGGSAAQLLLLLSLHTNCGVMIAMNIESMTAAGTIRGPERQDMSKVAEGHLQYAAFLARSDATKSASPKTQEVPTYVLCTADALTWLY